MSPYQLVCEKLKQAPKTWLVTGVAGFIGSNLLETLLKLDQTVVGLYNFATGYQYNLDEVQSLVSAAQSERFTLYEGDIRKIEDCQKVCAGVDYILHETALGSVSRLISDTVTTNQTNISGFLNMLTAAPDAKVSSFIYAASSSTYSDHPELPEVEKNIGKHLSPYADVFAKTYGFKAIGLRYFNVFGQRQDPNGAYATVIPKWVVGNEVFINGDGETSRDFCFIDNTVQANILAATTQDDAAKNQVYNVAVGDRTTLNDLYRAIQAALAENGVNYTKQAEYRAGDVCHSRASIAKIEQALGYVPEFRIDGGIQLAIHWYIKKLTRN